MKNRKVLLIEPDYSNKYPPIGLMKLATYHRNLGDDVEFFKGEFKEFILEKLYTSLVKNLYNNDDSVDWYKHKAEIKRYLKRGLTSSLELLVSKTDSKLAINNLLEYRSYYNKKEYLNIDEFKWDRICITTLFTFHWDKTVKTINEFKVLCSDCSQVFVGGITATVLKDKLEKETDVKCHYGLLDKRGILDDNNVIIDNLPLDYSILDEIDYKYPESDGYYGYMTRGCINNCSFCLVPKIEPIYSPYKSLLTQIEYTRVKFGEKRNLLLLDNNVLASDKFEKIVNEIVESGFGKDSYFVPPNDYEIAVAGLNENYNVRGNFKKLVACFEKLKTSMRAKNTEVGEKVLLEIHNNIRKYRLNAIETITIENVFSSYNYFKSYFEVYYKSKKLKRYIDFNQGLEAKLLTEEKARLLAKLPIKPLRVAFDHWGIRDIYENAIRNAAKYEITNMSNYLLYNYKDKPIELYKRLKMNVDLCEELDVNIYSFPMKYHPITDEKYFKNRNFIGVHWNKKFVRAIQAILNSTKGKVGRGKSFFVEAFGSNEDEYIKLLYMPEALIIYRNFFKNRGVTNEWWDSFSALNENEMNVIRPIIHENNFNELDTGEYPEKISNVLKFYLIKREDAEISV